MAADRGLRPGGPRGYRSLFADLAYEARYVPQQEIDWPTACRLVLAAFRSIGPELEAFAERAIADPQRLEVSTVPPGWGGGWCHAYDPQERRAGSWIVFERDGTLNDPIYFAHELGHLWAAERGLPREVNLNIVESQASFAQAAMYDCLFHLPSFAREARNHFRTEIGGMLLSVPLTIMAERAIVTGVSPVERDAHLVASYGPHWRDFPPAAAFNADDQTLLFAYHRDLNRHQMGGLIGTGLWFIAAEHTRAPPRIAEALYPTRAYGIGEALAELGWSQPDTLGSFACSAVAAIMREISQHTDRPVMRNAAGPTSPTPRIG